MVVMEEITVIGQNRVGLLADVAERLGACGVNIEAISAFGKDERAVIKLITSDVQTAIRELTAIPGLGIKRAPVVVVELLNRPGELAKITRKLAMRGIDIESVYVIGSDRELLKLAIKPAEARVEDVIELLEDQ